MTTETEAPDPQQPPLRYVVDSHRGWGIAVALAVVLGSLGPWFTVGAESADGRSTAGGTFLVGLWVLVLVTVRRKRVPRLMSAVFIGGLGVMAFVDQPPGAILGWGLLLVFAGSAGLAVWSLATIGASPTLDWGDAVGKVVGAVVLLWIVFGMVLPADDETAGNRPATSFERAQDAGAGGAEIPTASTAPSPATGEDGCETLNMWLDKGPEGSCTGWNGVTFQFANGDSTLMLYEVAVSDIAVDLTPEIAGDDGSPVQAAGTWAKVSVTVRNEGQAPIQVDPGMFFLDVGETSFSPDRGAMTVSSESCRRDTRRLRPGRKTTCWVAFDVEREREDDLRRSGALAVVQPSDVGEDQVSQPVGYVRLGDARDVTGRDQ